MSQSARISANTDSMISRSGEVFTLTRVAGGSINPVTGAVVAGTTTTYLPKGIYLKINSRDIDETRIKADDKMIMLDSTVEPLKSDKINGLNIVDVQVVKFNGVNMAFKVQARQ